MAGFTSAIILAMIALLIGYESVSRLFDPVPIRFNEAIPIAVVGLAVNVASAWLLSGDHHHGHGHEAAEHDEIHYIATANGAMRLEVFEDGVPPRFRLFVETGPSVSLQSVRIETTRPDGTSQVFAMVSHDDFLESVDEIPEPHEFKVEVTIGGAAYSANFEEHEHAHGSAHADNNMRAAVVHVIADAAVSVLVIVGLLLARTFGWLWMDPLAGIIGAFVIASWAFGLIRDTGAILLDMNPDKAMGEKLRQTLEANGDRVSDLHLWRLGPGHLGAVISIQTKDAARGQSYYRERLARFRSLSHLTVEVVHGF